MSDYQAQHPKRWLSETTPTFSTPRVVVHHPTLLVNIKRMQAFSEQHQLQLRPHFKTHKTIEIARLQLEHGAVGLTVSKIAEAETLFAEMGTNVPPILLAYPVVGEDQLARVVALQQKVELILMIDALEHAEQLQRYAVDHNCSFTVMVKINSGLNRCGIEPDFDGVHAFLHTLFRHDRLRFSGIMTHAGHAYGAESTDEVKRIGKYEGQIMATLARQIMAHYPQMEGKMIVSVGSTPTVRHAGQIAGVTEIRPGNYVFNDYTQVLLGSANWLDCALRVFSRVVSHPAPNRWIIDAGAKTLALDQGAHGKNTLSGFGLLVGHPQLRLTRLSEEHGVLEGEAAEPLRIGDLVEIIPNHACPVVNLTDHLHVLETSPEPRWFATWKVAARGKND